MKKRLLVIMMMLTLFACYTPSFAFADDEMPAEEEQTVEVISVEEAVELLGETKNYEILIYNDNDYTYTPLEQLPDGIVCEPDKIIFDGYNGKGQNVEVYYVSDLSILVKSDSLIETESGIAALLILPDEAFEKNSELMDKTNITITGPGKLTLNNAGSEGILFGGNLIFKDANLEINAAVGLATEEVFGTLTFDNTDADINAEGMAVLMFSDKDKDMITIKNGKEAHGFSPKKSDSYGTIIAYFEDPNAEDMDGMRFAGNVKIEREKSEKSGVKSAAAVNNNNAGTKGVQTGNESNILLYSMLCFISLISVFGLVIFRKNS